MKYGKRERAVGSESEMTKVEKTVTLNIKIFLFFWLLLCVYIEAVFN